MKSSVQLAEAKVFLLVLDVAILQGSLKACSEHELFVTWKVKDEMTHYHPAVPLFTQIGSRTFHTFLLATTVIKEPLLKTASPPVSAVNWLIFQDQANVHVGLVAATLATLELVPREHLLHRTQRPFRAVLNPAANVQDIPLPIPDWILIKLMFETIK
jgi:hypothetical protein